MVIAKIKDYILKHYNANVKNFSFLPPAARGKAHGAWRFAHSSQKLFIWVSVFSVSSVAKKIGC
jgi:hypothetical protein